MSYTLSPGAIPDVEPKVEVPDEWRQNLSVRMVCPDCKEDPPNLVEDPQAADVICGDCGMVLSQRGIDQRAEWRTFANDDQGNDDPSRVGEGPNLLLNGSQLQTNIAFGDGSLRSKELHRAQSKANADKGNKNLLQAFKQIGAYCDSYDLPNIVADAAKHIFKDAEDSNKFKGKSTEAIIAGCIFIACRRNQVGRTFREIYDMTHVSKKEIGRTFKLLENMLSSSGKNDGGKPKVMGNGVVGIHDSYQGTVSTNPDELCDRFCGQLGLDFPTTQVAKELAKCMASIGALAGRSPLSGAAACIYMASLLMDQVRSPKAIGEIAKVSDSTIRSAYKCLYAEKETLLTEDILKRGADPEKLLKPTN
ncbi:cyclin-like protein [Aureobasidium subglaciale]|nr:cyclin-like protein [Aureobasidium subglaciale]